MSEVRKKTTEKQSDSVIYKKEDDILNIGIEKVDRERIIKTIEIDKSNKLEPIPKIESNQLRIPPFHVSDAKIIKPSEEKPSLRKFIIDKVKRKNCDSNKQATSKGSNESLSKE